MAALRWTSSAGTVVAAHAASGPACARRLWATLRAASTSVVTAHPSVAHAHSPLIYGDPDFGVGAVQVPQNWAGASASSSGPCMSPSPLMVALAAATGLAAAAAGAAADKCAGTAQCADGTGTSWRRSELRHKAEVKSRLIKNLDFIYTCVCEGHLEDAYHLERQLGSGAFGKVLLARHKELGHCRAVKKVVKKPKGEQDQLEALIREIHALMDLDHPNIVKLVRYFDEGPNIYLVFELCQGQDLLQRIKAATSKRKRELRPGMTETEAADALRQILQALKCCHSNYMGHFDVKPENFMYESNAPEAKLKMIDFGLSSGFKRDRQEIRGTAQYMAPEVWDGLYGPEADIWSCGAVLFEMLTGSTLVPLIESEDEIQAQVHDRTWIRSRLRWAKSLNISDHAFDILSSMLQLNRHQRPSARELLWHPFFAQAAQAGSSFGLGLGCNDSSLLHEAEDILRKLPIAFSAFADEPVLKRAALLIMAHIAAYSFKACRPQRLAFAMVDKGADGELSIEAFENHYMRTNMAIPEGLERAFAGVDVDDDGYITYLEFLSATLPGEVRRDERLIRIVFRHLDRGGDGYIDARDLADALRHGLDRDHVCEQALAEVSHGMSRLSWKEFYNLIRTERPHRGPSGDHRRRSSL